MNNHLVPLLLVLSLVLGMGFIQKGHSEQRRYSISGSVQHPGAGRIYLFLVDEKAFQKQLSGITFVAMDVDRSGKTEFVFKDIPAGLYGIRCYQDVNGNGKLDGGLFGPQEPWGMSWNEEKPLGWPRFSHISFRVGGNIKTMNIQLK